MKKMLERGLLFVMLIIAAFVYTSCSNEDRLYLDNNSTDVDVELIASQYSVLFKEMYTSLLEEKKTELNSNLDIDLSNYEGKLIRQFLPKINAQNQLVQNLLPFKTRTLSDDKLSDTYTNFIHSIKGDIFDQDETILVKKISTYYESLEFTNLDKSTQTIIKLKLETLKKVRVALLESIYEFNTKSMTRISPGDRRIWSYTASNMSQCQLDASIDISLGVIGLVGAAVASPISGIVGVGIALWNYCTD